MSVKKLDFAAPFFNTEFVEDEQEYFVREKSLVVNLSNIDEGTLYVKNMPVFPLKGTTNCVNDEGEPADDVPAELCQIAVCHGA